jgi:hypothetical protein
VLLNVRGKLWRCQEAIDGYTAVDVPYTDESEERERERENQNMYAFLP